MVVGREASRQGSAGWTTEMTPTLQEVWAQMVGEAVGQVGRKGNGKRVVVDDAKLGHNTKAVVIGQY